MRHLPQELIDIVICHLRDDKKSLRSCSLTCSAWLHTSRCCMFEEISFNRRRSLSKWSQDFPLPISIPKEYVKNVTFAGEFLCSPTLSEDLLRHWRSFHRVRKLRVGELNLRVVQGDSLQKYCSHMLPSLQSLAVWCPQGTVEQLLNFVCMFPRLDDLEIFILGDLLSKGQSRKSPLPLSPNFRGHFCALNFQSLHTSGFLAALLQLPGGLHFRSLELTWSDRMPRDVFDTFFSACGATAESLEIKPNVFKSTTEMSVPMISLEHLISLRSLIVNLREGDNFAWISEVLETIHSSQFSSITLRFQAIPSVVKLWRDGVHEEEESDEALICLFRARLPDVKISIEKN